jgi:thiol-disulfide isomerase/thioredoxin
MRSAALLAGPLCLLILADAPCLPADEPRPSIGSEIRELRFKDIRYVPRTLSDLGDARAYVVVFTNTTCPIVRKSWPKLARLEAEYRERGVRFVGVNVGSQDTIADVAEQALDYGVEFPLVKDTDGSCVAALGVQRTPEVVVLDGGRRLRYRGRIDDQLRLGGVRPAPTREDLRLALDDVLSDREVACPETPVDGCLITPAAPLLPREPVTFYEHVLPILQAHCQECHRPKGTAPFALSTLEDLSAHAEMVAEVVAERRMPPWYGSRKQRFANERGLSAEERDVVAAWVRGGRLPGDPQRAPPPRTFPDSTWEIGEPDLITTALETHHLPADGFVDYKYVILPYVFARETWISAAEIRPSNPQTVHHCNMAYLSLGKAFDDGNFITGRVPGGTAMILDEGVALRIPAQSVLGLQIHYTTTGKPETNRMSVGLRFPRGTVRRELRHVQVTTSRLAIPPGAPAHPVTAARSLPCDAEGLGMFAHMHLRGKDMTFRARYPSGETETLLTIPNYHYAWQQNYRWQPGTKTFPAGTQIEVLAHYDNSAFNPFNPDPTITVKYGPQTVHEMMFGFFFYTQAGEDLNVRVDPRTGTVVDHPAN